MPRITLVPTGQTFLAEPGEPVLAAALRAGLNLPHSCKGGHCASCRARVLHGEFAYPGPRPPGLTEEEAHEGHALLCQAHAVTDLTLETREVRPAPDVDRTFSAKRRPERRGSLTFQTAPNPPSPRNSSGSNRPSERLGASAMARRDE